jgi:two-component system chemotaxis response regulator CheY
VLYKDPVIFMTSLMIVDDDERMRSLIRSIVADLADPITECADGAEAQAIYERLHPDWVLMDVMMPGMNGLVATSKIVAFDPSAKIVIVTGNESQRWRDAATSAGPCAFVSKENLLDLRQLIEPGTILSE